jgi:hypothetical protein
MLANNPLKQYFRRPCLYFKLPSEGKYYLPGVVDIPVNGELPVYPMTAIDEMTIRTPDGLFNGSAVIDLIKSCIPNILDPWKLNNVDLDATLIAIRAAANDGKMSIDSECPSCHEKTEYEINLMPMLANMKDVNYSQVLKIRELEIKFKPLTFEDTNKNGSDQMDIQRSLMNLDSYPDEEKQIEMNKTLKKLSEMVIKVVSDTIDYIRTPELTVTEKEYIIEFLNNCDRETNNTIKDYSIKLREESELKPINVNCPQCQHEYQQKIVLNVTDFFD